MPERRKPWHQMQVIAGIGMRQGHRFVQLNAKPRLGRRDDVALLELQAMNRPPYSARGGAALNPVTKRVQLFPAGRAR